MKKNKENVYCCNCKYLGSSEGEMGEFHYLCYFPLNIIVEKDAICKYKILEHTPEARNKDNNCLAYKKKWYKFWIKEE